MFMVYYYTICILQRPIILQQFTCNNRSIGVSNFAIHHLEGLKKEGLPLPSINQIELHPWMRREVLVDYCRKEGIDIMGYSPLAKAFNMAVDTLNEIANK